jgi:hypothetical protein
VSRPATNEAIGAYLRWRVEEWVKAGKSARQLAKAAGVSTTQISVLRSTGAGAGWKTMEGRGKVFGLSTEQLLQVSKEWAADRPTATPGPSVAAKRRAVAAELAREDESISSEAIKSVLDEPLRDEDANRSTIWWIKRILRRDVPA